MVASSDALRLRAFGIEMSTAFHADYPIEHWFLKGKNDVRSSFALEFAATEFECQGLELDNVLMCWANDLCWDEPSMKWRPRKFIGEKWAHVQKAGNITYALNKYRVLLTRFRESMLIWIPPGKQEDATVKQEDFDSIANVLFDAGILPL